MKEVGNALIGCGCAVMLVVAAVPILALVLAILFN